MKFELMLLNGLMAGAIALPTTTTSNAVVQKRDAANPRWVKREALAADTKIPVRIALKQSNLEHGMDYLLEVSDPDSPKYGQHYTADQVTDLFAPKEESVASVKQWLVKSGIPASSISSSRSKGWIQFTTTSAKLESLLNAQYHVYDHTVARHTAHVGTDEYTLPSHISPHVDFITPSTVFAKSNSHSLSAKLKSHSKRDGNGSIRRPVVPLPDQIAHTLAANPNDLSNCSQAISPACIRALYQIPLGKLAAPGNELGIFEDFDTFAKEDITAFIKGFAPFMTPTTLPKVDGVDGATAPTPVADAGAESDLDFEMAMPIVYPQNTIVFETNTQNIGLFNTFLDAIDGPYCHSTAFNETGDDPNVDGFTSNEQCGAYKRPNAVSFSYGDAEVDLPTPYLERQCLEFMKLGLQGTSSVMSSGDTGVARFEGLCLGPKENIFVPQQQASCPYITAVGSTVLPAGSKLDPTLQTSTTSFSSGGGFSNIWTTPRYQSAAVSSYFKNHNPTYPSYKTSNGTIPTTGGIYNRIGRGYPDLSALGDNGIVIIKGKQGLQGGTSMSAPIVAAIFTRINEERIAIGKGPIGFANPALYKNPSMFTDIVVGDQSKGGGFSDGNPSVCGNDGFHSVSGWDPVSGLGTPKYPEMLKYFLSL